MNEIIFLTGNEKKFEVAKKYFDKVGLTLIRQKHQLIPEIQHLDCEEVVKFSVKYMAEKLGKPVVKSDQGFYIPALNNFPGALMSDVEKAIGTEGFLRIMKDIKERQAYFKEALAFCEPGKDPVIFTGVKQGCLAESKQGNKGWGVDFIFVPEGKNKPAACYSSEELLELYDMKLWPKMIDFIINH